MDEPLTQLKVRFDQSARTHLERLVTQAGTPTSAFVQAIITKRGRALASDSVVVEEARRIATERAARPGSRAKRTNAKTEDTE